MVNRSKYTHRVSLSTIVLNTRDWSENIWLLIILHFHIDLPKDLYLKNPAGMHWLGHNDAVSQLNKTKTLDLQLTYKISKLTCILSASQPANMPTLRSGSIRCKSPEISLHKNNGNK